MSELCHPVAKQLKDLIVEKKSRLSIAADLTKSKKILELADLIGPYITVFKTHVDIIEDFTLSFVSELQSLARKHQFLIFEDRKFADIGNTVKRQYQGGLYKIADWATITNAHCVPGPGIIEGLASVGVPKGNGLLLLAQMSSSETLAAGDTTKKAVEWARRYPDFVMGFICTERLTEDPNMIHMMPGVKMALKGDGLGQRYVTPEEALGKRGVDIIIVGRGITESHDPRAEAIRYRDATQL